MAATGRARDEAGVTLPSPVVAATIVAIALAALAYVVTGDRGDDAPDTARSVAEASPAASPTSKAKPSPTSSASPAGGPTSAAPEPEVDRGGVFVEVYNNSGIAGLAGTVADRASSAGWNVVGVDNWHGNIPESTVYYPERLKAEAEVLAEDLGLGRVYPAVELMRFDRLTVILTSAP